MVRFVSGVGLALVFLLGGYVLEGGGVMHLVVFTPFLVTFFVPAFGVLAVWSFKDWGKAWRDAFHPADAASEEKSVEIWKFVEVSSYLAGIVAFLMGGILILTNLDNASAKWYVSLSYGLVSPLYGGVFGLVARVLRFRVEGGHA